MLARDPVEATEQARAFLKEKPLAAYYDEILRPAGAAEKAEAASEHKPLPDKWRTGKPVLCIPGPSLLDEAAAMMVAHLIERQGIGARH